MPDHTRTSPSRDHVLEQKGIQWKDSTAEEDFVPHIPREDFDGRIARARDLLAKHGIDAMALFSYDNKYYYGGYRESNIRYSHRWRHCVIVSQEHEPVFVGESVLANSVRRTTWIRDLRLWSQIKFWRLPLRFIDVFTDTVKSLRLDNKVIGLEYGPEYVLEVSIDEIREIERSLPNATGWCGNSGWSRPRGRSTSCASPAKRREGCSRKAGGPYGPA
jgi:hypothetical protein